MKNTHQYWLLSLVDIICEMKNKKMNSKIIKSSDLKKKVHELRKQNKKIVQCHGVFDVVHIGHINHFKKAKDYGSVTIVTVTSDRFVNKGINRPIFSQEKRIAFIAELDCVDYVFKDYPDAVNLIKIINQISI